jgi:Cu(I)-responsive transcriptional regulator
MQIKTVSQESGVPAKTIRYYEQIGLIRPAVRSANGYRHYDHADVQTLLFIHRARSLGFAVKDVGNLLALWMDKHRASSAVKALARDHVVCIDRKIAELESMRRTLVHLMERCHGDDRPECPILDDLAMGGEGEEATN